MMNLIDIVHEEIDRLSSMADIASIEFNIFCSKTKLDAKVKTVKPLVDVVVWKVIEEFPNYMVSNKGDVMNTKTRYILKAFKDTPGYPTLSFVKDKVKRNRNVHVLVARAHLENPHGHACVDHIDRNITNCDITNLRWCSHTQNMRNMTKRANASSTYKGVHWQKSNQKWCARIRVDGKLMQLGYFHSEVQAGITYNNAAIIHFKEFACLNVIPVEVG